MLTIKKQCSYKIEVGKDPHGNIMRISNALADIEKQYNQTVQKLETLQDQLETARLEVQKPFPQEDELTQKTARLSELNSLLNMDEKGSADVIGMDEESVDDTDLSADKPKPFSNLAVKPERVSDAVRKPSILAKLKEKQVEKPKMNTSPKRQLQPEL